MKKNFLGLAAIPMLALLATSCAQETVEIKGGDNVLTYGVATGKQTLSRAAEATVADLEDGFDVSVFYTTGAAFDPATLTVSGSGGVWSYAEHPVYHPTTALSHYAAEPAQTFAGGGAAVSFPFTANGEIDLIAAADETTNADATAATAQMTFNHLLSQINFEVTGKLADNIAIEIGNITLNGLADASTYTLSNGNTGSWAAPTGDAATYTYTFGAADATTGKYVGVTDGGLMLMPQTPAGSFTFTYTLKSADTDAVIGTGSPVVPFSSINNTPWTAGLRYLYVINFTSPVTIEYKVDVNPWEDPVSGQVNI